MKRYEMIKDKNYFSSIIKNGKYNKDKLFVVYRVDSPLNEFPHFGIAIKNSLGKAFLRNKLKRQVRSIIDENKNLFKKNRDY
ncbi:MAG TPA: ribonuclease P protein component, partial [Firmicutes bacterium]|nr:ribonuclease P protein component [Bacillota bacterium]